jgi:hypothetical protein
MWQPGFRTQDDVEKKRKNWQHVIVTFNITTQNIHPTLVMTQNNELIPEPIHRWI